jgi:ATP-dependent helicase/nuclease subunit A
MNDTHLNSELTIIRASAGSGKTRRLTLEYIKLLFQNPAKYRNILAVTFTNKATAEMKSRIFSELREFALGTDDNYSMLSEVAAFSQRTIPQVRDIARTIMRNMLHDYAHFTVSTIDHFFQGIIRALTRELNLNGGYAVQLDQTTIINQSVERFLMGLKSGSQEMQVMLDFVDAQMDDDKTWNVQHQLNKFAAQLFREHVRYNYVRSGGNLSGNQSFDEVSRTLKQLIQKFQAKVQLWSQQVAALLEKAEIQQEDLQGKSNNPLHGALKNIEARKYEELFKKVDRMLAMEEWGHPKSERKGLVDSLEPQITEFVEQLEAILKADYVLYIEAKAVYSNIFQHRLASAIMNNVTEVLADQNLFMLADAPVLLSLFTGSSDTPFIYEKIGHLYKHYMIDEFQDTSQLQWDNFRPLIEEALAHDNHGNFIVGDVKQAIYRWRNGDWSLLHKEVAKQIGLVNEDNLTTNWRSSANVVAFNNAFFVGLRALIADLVEEEYAPEILEMYKDVVQELPDHKKDINDGYVYVEGVDGSNADTFTENALDAMVKQVDRLQKEHGQQDVCVLVRKNDEVSLVGTRLIEEGYAIVSSGSLSLGGSKMLQLIITVFRYLYDPAPIYLKTIAYLNNKTENNSQLHSFFTSDTEHYLPDAFLENIDQLAALSPLSAITEIVHLFGLDDPEKRQNVFLGRFYNEVKKVVTEKGGSIGEVLKWWSEEGKDLSIEVTHTAPDGIRILTLHKSKGLQFKNVIIPFAHWQKNTKIDTLWLQGNAFSIPVLHGGFYPAELSSKHSVCPVLSKYFEDEVFAMIVDQVNMLYVANTRAVDNLFIIYSNVAKGKNDVSKWIKTMMEDHSENGLASMGTFPHESVFELGTLRKVSAPEVPEVKIPQINLFGKAQVKIRSNISRNNEEDHVKGLMAVRGTMLHHIFEQIITSADIEKAVDAQLNGGMLAANEATELKAEIHHLLKQETVCDWFANDVKVLTEAEIVVPGYRNRRPDRVVINDNQITIIDYKFGVPDYDRHTKQVRSYMKLFSQMGYRNIFGYVWYPQRQEVTKVD